MKVLEIITLEQLRALRDAGFVVVHREPTESMVKAGLSESGIGYHYGDMRKEYHRMVGESIRLQNLEDQPG